MGSVDDISQLCRLCLVKDQVNIPIFDGSSEIGQTFVKINSCLPVKVSRDDNLPKKICDGCSYKLDMLYIFRNTSVDSEKQLISWLSQSGLSTISQAAAKDPLANAKPEIMVKQETFDSADSRVEGDNPDMGVDAQNYILQQQQLPYQQDFEFGEPSGSIAEMTDEPTPKRAKRAAALKKAPIEDIEETEDDLDAAMQITKAEEEDSEDVDQPDYVEAPSTSADDQPGPSGVGKAPVEAPCDTDLFKKEDLENNLPDHPVNKKYYCAVCNTDFLTYSKLKNHRRNHKTKDHVCALCGKGFKNGFELKIHNLSHSKEKPFECDLCGATFKCKNKRNYHRRCHETPDKQHICPICGKTYNQFGKGALLVHMRKHKNSGSKCKICDEFVPDDQNKKHRSTHTLPYRCQLCDKTYRYKAAYTRHIAIHNGFKYLCSYCGKEMTSSTSFKNHVRLHTGEKPYQCTFCDKKFSASHYLKQHLRTHTNERPYGCDYCEKRFNQRGPLKIHMRAVHTGETPYKCGFCSKGFISRTLLNLHNRVPCVELDPAVGKNGNDI